MVSPTTYPTRRHTVPAMEDILGKEFPLLDHGFIRLIDYMGGDDTIVQAARVSYGTGTVTKNNTEGLINYLMRNAHTSPFEMCEIKLHVKLPIFVARQWIRHRTANVNEYSARYSVLDREFYVPESDDIQPQSTTNKQGRGGQWEDDNEPLRARNVMRVSATRSFDAYDHLLRKDVSRELARITLPVNAYTQWYWKVDLHNLLHFLHLRQDAHAQKEIRDYADVLADIVKQWVPITHDAFMRHVVNKTTFSPEAVKFLQATMARLRGAPIVPPLAETMGKEERALVLKLFCAEIEEV